MMDRDHKAEYVHGVFSRIAGRYDQMNSVLSFRQHIRWRKFAMSKLDIARGMDSLDVAAGTGDWTIALAQASGPAGETVGLDFCQEMLDMAKEKVRRASDLTRIAWVRGDAMALPFADDKFDVATIGFALRNVPDVLTVLKEMNRVVKPGGRVVSLELSKPSWGPFRRLYYFYFYHILPLIGGLVVGSKADYAWLPESLTDFPNRKELEQLFRDAGLCEVRSYGLTGGIAALHIGRKALA